MRIPEVAISFRAQRGLVPFQTPVFYMLKGTRMALLVVGIIYYLVTLKRMLENLLNACIMCRRVPTGVGKTEEM